MVTIRPEATTDHAVVRQIHERAFPSPAEAQLVELLRNAGKAKISLVATDADEVVGHILFSPVTIADADSGGVGLAPVAVDPDRHQEGIGSALIRAGIDACRAAGAPFVVVLGDPSYYGRFGFEPASQRGLGNEYGVDAEFMAQELTAGALPIGGGLCRYADEFGQLDA